LRDGEVGGPGSRAPTGASSSAGYRPPGRGRAIAGDDELGPAAAGAPRLEGVDGTGSDLSRLFSLSDGVFAFAMTFLAVSLLLPQALGTTALPTLTSYLRKLEPGFITYILSFFVIASWWGVHHRLFSALARYDPLLVRLNTFFLLVISITPFLVSLLLSYSTSSLGPGSLSSRFSVVLYAGIQALGGVTLLAIWRHATAGRRLVRPTLTEAWIRHTERNQLLTVVVFVASMGIAFASPLIAELLWIVVIFGFSRRFLRRGPPPAPSTAGKP
jgi:uncharacterized membrane protein